MAITEGLNIQKARIPPLFRCPISLDLMKDPVTLSTGLTYDRCNIEKWFEDGHNTCPATMQVLTTLDLVPNHTLRRLIQEWCVANKSKGVERIPTPKQPLEIDHAKQMLHQVSNSSLDSKKRIHLVRTLRSFARDSEKNRKCMAEAGAIHVLLGLISSSDTSCNDLECCDLSVTIVSMLVRTHHSSLISFKVTVSLLRMLSWILNNRSIEYQISAARVLEALAELDDSCIGETKGVVSGLVKLLKDGYPRAIKAGLGALMGVVSGRKSVPKAVITEGAIPPLVELLAETNRQNTELSLAVLERLVRYAEGRAALVEHALSTPILVKIILTVSDLASERAVNILWIMCKSDESVVEAVANEGGFTQMLLLIQADNTIHTVQRARELMKMLRTAVSQECLQNFAFTMPF